MIGILGQGHKALTAGRRAGQQSAVVPSLNSCGVCLSVLVVLLCVGGTVTASARSLGHTISFCVTLAMMLAITAYMIYCSRRRHGPHCFKYGPTYIMLMASVLIMADLVRHVLQDANIWPEPSSRQYRPGCHDETFKCLSGIGIVFTILCTYIGFALLMVRTTTQRAQATDAAQRNGTNGTTQQWGTDAQSETRAHSRIRSLRFIGLVCAPQVATMWNADLLGKLSAMREKWRELRGNTQ